MIIEWLHLTAAGVAAYVLCRVVQAFVSSEPEALKEIDR
jgi:hypothetical protein